MRVVTVGAHQDDMEVWALGTVLRYFERGDLEALTVICLTNGDKESATPVDRDAYAATRASEATAVANALGGEYVGLGEEDEYLFDGKEIREKLVRAVRAARPDVILCPSIDDLNNTDHATAGKIAIQVALLAQVGTICPDVPPLTDRAGCLRVGAVDRSGFRRPRSMSTRPRSTPASSSSSTCIPAR